VLDQFAVADPEDVEELQLDAIPGRRQVPEFTQMRAPERLCGWRPDPLGELLIY
jgi:hypothetical protein